jgi:hypothetical protein
MHIEFEVGNLVCLNIQDFKMLEILTSYFIICEPYKMFYKPHLDL